MRNVDIEVFLLAYTQPHEPGHRAWLNYLGVKDYTYPPVTGPTMQVGHAAKRCYMSFKVGLNPNITKIREDWVKYIDNILASGHGSVLEHSTYSFAFEGVSRVFTGEMNRHRAGVAISEGSMRYIRFDDIPYWVPKSIQGEGAKEENTRSIFEDVFQYVEERYKELVAIWNMDGESFSKKKQITSCLRRIIPMGVATGGVWTFNLRALRHILALRTSEAAEEEIAHVFSKVGKIITEIEPLIFGDFEEKDGCWIPKYEKV